MGMMPVFLNEVDQGGSGAGNPGMEKLIRELPGALSSSGGGSLLEKLEYPPFLREAWPPMQANSLGDMWFFCLLVVLLVVVALTGIMFLYFRCGCSGGTKKTARELCLGIP